MLSFVNAVVVYFISPPSHFLLRLWFKLNFMKFQFKYFKVRFQT